MGNAHPTQIPQRAALAESWAVLYQRPQQQPRVVEGQIAHAWDFSEFSSPPTVQMRYQEYCFVRWPQGGPHIIFRLS